MQPRLEKRGKTAFHLLEHLRFRAGYDFLLLRCEAGEVPAEVGQWWTRFIDAGTPEREELIRSLAPQAATGNKRRRRRSGSKAPSADEARPGSSMQPLQPGPPVQPRQPTGDPPVPVAQGFAANGNRDNAA
jgi:poly(A) polymerase